MASQLERLLRSQTLDDLLAADDADYELHDTDGELCPECGAAPCSYCGWCHQVDGEIDHLDRCPEI